jgi:hypothetical protein
MSTRPRMTGSGSLSAGAISTRTLVYLATALLVVIATAFASYILKNRETPEQQAQRLTKTYGIRVEFGDPSTFYTPPYGPSDAKEPGFEPEPADPELAAVAMEGIEAALTKYPPGFVDKLIDAVFICGKLRMDGALAGGSAGPAWLVLSAPDDLTREHVRTLAEFTFHHELSSHVLRKDPTTIERWTAFAPPDAQFVKGVRETLARDGLTAPDPSTGFLSAYGSTNPENDFNTYAEEIFADAERLKLIARDQSLIKRKLQFVLDIYEHIDPRFHKYFIETGFESAQ